jgi:hypothetical protein
MVTENLLALVKVLSRPTNDVLVDLIVSFDFLRSSCSTFRSQRKRRSPRGLRHSCSSNVTYVQVRAAIASERPSIGPIARVAKSLRASLNGILSQHEVRTNEEPRHQPTRHEARSNQRIYVPLGSPPSVAVGSSSARAAHRSRAPQIDIKV